MDSYVYIAAALLMGLLIGLVCLSISWLQRTLTRAIRGKTLNLLSLYDQLLEEKSQALSRLAAQPAPPAAAPPPEAAAPAPELSGAVLSTIQRATAVPYREENTAQLYRTIRSHFSYSLRDVLPVLEQAGPAQAGPATGLLGKVDQETFYQLSTLTWQEQQEILESVLEEKEQQLLRDYAAAARHPGSLQFYDYLCSLAAAEPGQPRLRVAPEVAERYAGGPIQVLADPEICEGYQIEQDNVLYDFSIKTRELS